MKILRVLIIVGILVVAIDYYTEVTEKASENNRISMLSKEEREKEKLEKQMADEAKRLDNEKFTVVVLAVRSVKNSVKDPRSFELTKAILTDDEVLCLEFRAKNSFNAVVPGLAVITRTESSFDERVWNSRCAGKKKEILYAR